MVVIHPTTKSAMDHSVVDTRWMKESLDGWDARIFRWMDERMFGWMQ